MTARSHTRTNRRRRARLAKLARQAIRKKSRVPKKYRRRPIIEKG